MHVVIYRCGSVLNMIPTNNNFIDLFAVHLYLVGLYVGAIRISAIRELRRIFGLKNISQCTNRKQKFKVNRICDKHKLYKLGYRKKIYIGMESFGVSAAEYSRN